MIFPHSFRWAAAVLLAATPFLAACSDDEAPQGPTVPSVSPGTSFLENDELVFHCDFQDAAYARRQFSQYNLARLTPTHTMQGLHFSADSAWIYSLKDSPDAANAFAGSTSSFTPAGKADAWFVTRPIDLPASGVCTLSWLSESLSLDKPDGLKVFVSTTGGNPATDFAGEPLWQTEAEPAGESETLDGEWNAHSVSLQDYAGQRVWIAFVNQTTDGMLLCLDDVTVQAKAPFLLHADMPRMTDAETVTVKGSVTARNAPLTAYTVHYTCADSVVRTKTYTGLNLQPGESHEFAFDEPLHLAASRGSYVGYRVWADAGVAECVGTTDSVASVPFVPQHKVVIEEGTGAWCGWCPLGVLAFEHLYSLYPDNFIGIAVHNEDPLAVADYDGNLRCPAFPLGAINRTEWGQPMINTDNDYFFDAPGSWQSLLERALETLATFDVRIDEAVLSGQTVEVKARLRFAMGKKAPKYHVAYVLTEDDVEANFFQMNYLAQYTLPAFGKFGAGQEFGQQRLSHFVYQDVARGIWPEYYGKELTLPATVPSGASYPVDAAVPLEGMTVANPANLSLTVLILDVNDGYVIVAADKKKVSL